MIIGLDVCPAGRCFEEIDEAVRQIRGRDDVVFNAHRAPDRIPPGAIVYNFENIGTNGVEARPDAFEGHELWDFSARNCEAWRAAGREVKHVPVGYHPSMTKFQRLQKRDIDVLHYGCLNERRAAILRELRDLGWNVFHIEGIYGEERDRYLASARLCVVPLYYPDGVFPALRAAHLDANGVPAIYEWASDWPDWVGRGYDYDDLVYACARALHGNTHLWASHSTVDLVLP